MANRDFNWPVEQSFRSRRLRFWRKIPSRPMDLTMIGDWTSDSRSSEEMRLANFRVGIIEKAILELPFPQRTAFLLRFVEELPLAEIAQVMRVGDKALKGDLSQAVTTVRIALKKACDPNAR